MSTTDFILAKKSKNIILEKIYFLAFFKFFYYIFIIFCFSAKLIINNNQNQKGFMIC